LHQQAHDAIESQPMSESKSHQPAFDPFEIWKPFQDAWAKALSESVSSEDFAKAMGKSLDEYLQTYAPMRQQMEKLVERYLQQLNMPTRNEVISLAERLTNIEMRLDDLDAKLDDILDQFKTARAASPKPRTMGKIRRQ
jgi:polyhydroxyalkanoic acid synthase PhaR subunit